MRPGGPAPPVFAVPVIARPRLTPGPVERMGHKPNRAHLLAWAATQRACRSSSTAVTVAKAALLHTTPLPSAETEAGKNMSVSGQCRVPWHALTGPGCAAIVLLTTHLEVDLKVVNGFFLSIDAHLRQATKVRANSGRSLLSPLVETCLLAIDVGFDDACLKAQVSFCILVAGISPTASARTVIDHFRIKAKLVPTSLPWARDV